MTPESRSRRHYVFTNPTPVSHPVRDPVLLLTLALRDDGLADELARGREIEVEDTTFRVVAHVVVP